MINKLKKSYALDDREAKSLFNSILLSLMQDITSYLPQMFSFYFLYTLLENIKTAEIFQNKFFFYSLISLAILIVLYTVNFIASKNIYGTIYFQSSNKRIKIAEKLRKLPLSYFEKKDVADLSNTIMTDITEFEELASHALPQVYSALIFLFISGISFLIFDFKMALALLFVIPISLIIFMISNKIQFKIQDEIFKQKRVISDKFQENLEMANEIKSYSYEKNAVDEVSSELKNYENLLRQTELWIGSLINLIATILNFGIVSTAYFGTIFLVNGEISLFKYLVFVIASASIYEPILNTFNHLAALIHLKPKINRFKEIIDSKVQDGKKDFELDSFDIEFRNVNFSYEEEKTVIKNASFIAKQGEVTALIGPSGGGKSTITKLCARFWDIDSGIISIGGKDISKLEPEKLLQYFSIVFQNVVLFNTSIRENILIGNKDASDEELRRVCKLANCDEFIEKLPNKYDEIIGENGEKLSGGERQRISIARAMLKNSPIILLDEATSSLDVYNESKVQKALSTLIKDKTVIVIAHRMRTISNADKIIVVKDGEIKEQGSPDDLIKRDLIFKKMIEIQG